MRYGNLFIIGFTLSLSSLAIGQARKSCLTRIQGDAQGRIAPTTKINFAQRRDSPLLRKIALSFGYSMKFNRITPEFKAWMEDNLPSGFHDDFLTLAKASKFIEDNPQSQIDEQARLISQRSSVMASDGVQSHDPVRWNTAVDRANQRWAQLDRRVASLADAKRKVESLMFNRRSKLFGVKFDVEFLRKLQAEGIAEKADIETFIQARNQ